MKIKRIKRIYNMEREKIENKVNDVLVDVLRIDYSEIKDDAVLEADLGADSIDAVEIVMELEHEFGITITDEKMYELSMAKVSDVYDLVEGLLRDLLRQSRQGN